MADDGRSHAADPLQAALQDIKAGIAALDPLCPPALRVEFAGLQHAFQRVDAALVQSSAEMIVDGGVLDRLLTLAGPAQADELLNRLDADLAQVAQRIEAAVPKADYAEIRGATHVLISLAGSVGARGLEERARQLNQSANRPNPGDLAPCCQRLVADIALLGRSVARKRRQPAGGTP